MTSVRVTHLNRLLLMLMISTVSNICVCVCFLNTRGDGVGCLFHLRCGYPVAKHTCLWTLDKGSIDSTDGVNYKKHILHTQCRERERQTHKCNTPAAVFHYYSVLQLFHLCCIE